MKKLIILLSLLLIFSGLRAQTINTFAGNGIAGYSGDGGPATATELYSPSSVAIDGSGNVYITDQSNARVRKVNISGIISTFAGNGTLGFLGDGGPAIAAELNGTGGVAVDASGNVYIADDNNNRVRKVNTAGVISTFAGNGTSGFFGDGGPATTAELSSPNGIAVDGSGNIYIADYSNNRIRIVNTLGVINTFAGNGIAGFFGDGGPATAAELHGPTSIAVWGGNVYIADNSNHRIRIVNTSGVISTFAGNGTAGFFGDGGPATSAEILSLQGVCTDGSGNVYISDEANNRIRKVNTSGIISTFAGNGTGGFFGDGGPATAAEIYLPIGICSDGISNIYIADRANERVRMVSGTTSSIAPITGTTSVCVGATTTLSDTGSGVWSSGSTGIATIGSTGAVTGVAPGTAVITYADGGSSATIIVTVTAPPSAAISGAASMCVGSTVTLTGATAGGVWSSLHTTIATVGLSSGIVNGVTAGNDTIKYKVTNTCGSDSAKHPVSVITGGTCSSGIHHHGKRESPPYNGDALSVYPNPNKGSFTLQLETDIEEPVQVIITNMVGQMVKEFSMKGNDIIDVKLNQPPGIYFVAARTASQMYFMKVEVE